MAKKLVLCISLLFFVFSVSPAIGEPVLPNFDAECQSFLSVDHQDSSPEIDYGSLLLSRFLRGKSSLKSLPNLNTHTATHKLFLAGWINKTLFAPPFSTDSVYQHINVYRL
jgi:hypothetical protein